MARVCIGEGAVTLQLVSVFIDSNNRTTLFWVARENKFAIIRQVQGSVLLPFSL
jgi:hypothetical protein